MGAKRISSCKAWGILLLGIALGLSTTEAQGRPRYRAVALKDADTLITSYGNASPGAYPQINDFNQVVFLNMFVGGRFTCLYWEDGKLIRLGGEGSYERVSGYAINQHGEVAGSLTYNTGTSPDIVTHGHAFLTSGQQIAQLPLDPGAHFNPLGCFQERATDLNDFGVAAGWVYRPLSLTYGLQYPVVWQGGIVDIGPLSGHPPDSQFMASFPILVNNSGTVAGVQTVNYSGCNSCQIGYTGSPGAISEIVAFPGGNRVGLWDINNLGVIAGQSDGIFGGSFVPYHAMLVEGGTKKDIHGTVYPATMRSQAYAVNDSGVAVGMFGNLRALYHENDTTWLLDSLVVNTSFPDLYEAFDINNRGYILALYGYPSGTPYPCILVPVDSGVIVNTDTDLPDQNPGDGRCYTGRTTPLGEDECSFRAAIQHTNATPGVDTIRFDIPGAGLPTILVNSPLPAVTERVVIDAVTQPGVERVEVMPSDSLVGGDGLVISAGRTTVRGLLLNRFAGSGLKLTTGDNNRVERCFFGVQLDSVTAAGNGQHGVMIVSSDSNHIGNGFDDEANFMAYNGGAGVYVQSGTANVFLRNIYHHNGGLGIDLAPLGVNLNDSLDSDGGANAGVNYAYVDSVTTAAGQSTLYGTMIGEPLVSYVVEISKSDSCDPSGYGEGLEAVWSTVASTNLAGVNHFATLFSGVLDSGEVYALTATDTAKSTSEFGPCWPLKRICLEDGQQVRIALQEFALSRVAHDVPVFTETLIDTVTTDSTGCIDLRPYYDMGELFTGDSIKVSRVVDSIPRSKLSVFTPGRSATLYLDNGKFDSSNADYFYDDLDREPEQIVRVTHTTLGLNLVMCVQWEADTAYMGSLTLAMQNLSNYLYDVTDGQLRLDTVQIFSNSFLWNVVDVHIRAANNLRPHSAREGLFDDEDFGYVDIGRRWFGTDPGSQVDLSFQEWPMRPDDDSHFRTIGHELGHYVLGLLDEYFDGVAQRCMPGHYYGFMDLQYVQFEPEASEMSWSRQYASSPCRNTRQWLYHGESCWDTFERVFQGTYHGLWTEILRPDERNIPGSPDHFLGPNNGAGALQYDVGSLVEVQLNLQPRSSRDIPVTIRGRGGVPLKHLDVETWQKDNGRRIEQGLTSSTGGLWILGVESGDSLFAAGGRLRSSFARGLAAAADSDYVWHSISLEVPVGPLDSLDVEAVEVFGYYPALASLELNPTDAVLNLQTLQPFAATPQLEFWAQPDSGSASTLAMTPTVGGYAVTLPLDSAYHGTTVVNTQDDSAQTFFFGIDIVVEKLNGSERPVVVTSSDGANAVRADSVSGAGRVALATCSFLPIRTGLHASAQRGGATMALATLPSALLEGEILAIVQYDESDLAGAPSPFDLEATLKMFHWDLGSGQWNLVGGVVDTSQNIVSAAVSGPGIYAAFTTGQVTGVGDEHQGAITPDTYELAQNYPNPFNPTTSISYTIPFPGRVKLHIHNILGQTVRTLVDEVGAAGRHEVVWDGRTESGEEAGSGVYFYSLRAGDVVLTRKMVLMK